MCATTTTRSKVISRAELVRRVRAARSRGERIVMCHGCFDLLHPGHVHHLESAAAMGHKLVVTVTADAFVDKGPGRPLLPASQRASCLAALAAVDCVAINEAPTAVAIIEAVRPDVYVKGAEYAAGADPRFADEHRAVLRHGGRVAFTSGEVVFSSTGLIENLHRDSAYSPLMQSLSRVQIDWGGARRRMAAWRGMRVLVVGETIIDRYVLCERSPTAQDHGVRHLRPMGERSYDGGAAVIARHLAAFGACPALVTAFPQDDRANALEARLQRGGIEVRAVRRGALLPLKIRYACDGLPVAAIDAECGMVIDDDAWRGVMTGALGDPASGDGWDAAIVVDYGLGLFTGRRMRDLCAALRPIAGVLAGDVSGPRTQLAAMRGMDLLCPNEGELRAAMGDDSGALDGVVARLRNATGVTRAIITRGCDGLAAFDEGRLWAMPALAARGIDPLGCGDALLSAAALALAAGGPLAEACVLGSLAAACQAERLGNDAIGAADIGARVAAVEQRAGLALIEVEPGRGGITDDHLSAAHAQSA